MVILSRRLFVIVLLRGCRMSVPAVMRAERHAYASADSGYALDRDGEGQQHGSDDAEKRSRHCRSFYVSLF
jgi:hypothetical protein